MAKVYPTTVGPHGYIYYKIPKDEVFYRGDTQIYLDEGRLPEGPAFFGNLKKRVKKYGMVFRFKTRRPLLLLALDLNRKVPGVQDNLKVYEDAPEKYKKILKNNYGFDTPKGLRETEFKKDHELLKYLCNDLKIDGYYNNEMNVPDDIYVDEFEDDGSADTDPLKFHSEMGLCDVRKNMEFVNYLDDIKGYSEEEKLNLAQVKKAKDVKYADEEKRNESRKKNRMRYSSEEEFSDPFGLTEGTGSLSLSDLSGRDSSERDSEVDSVPMQQAIFRDIMESSPNSKRSSSSSSASRSPSSSSRKPRGQNLFSSPIFSPVLDDVPEDKAIPRTFSNLEDRLAFNQEDDPYSQMFTSTSTSTPGKRRESPVPFDMLLEQADVIESPSFKKQKKSVSKQDGKGGKRKSKKIKNKKTNKNKTLKKKRHTFKKSNKRKIKQTRK